MLELDSFSRTAAGILLAALIGAVAAPPASAQSSPSSPTAQDGPPQYVPPLRGAPKGRVGGASRGSGADEAMELDVLAPDHVGLTTQAQPTLYWFNSRRIDAPAVLTISRADAERPLLEMRLPQPLPAGINAVALASTPARLEAGAEYEWSVSVVTDAAERSKDVMAGGIIKRVAPSETTRALSIARPAQAARSYAAAGLWYDAIDVLSQAIAKAPADRSLRQGRSALLEQVGLLDAAAFDRNASP